MAPCPVLTVGPETSETSATDVRLDHILYPVEFVPDPGEAAAYAVSLAEEYHANPVACAIAKKQLYSSHYFQTALDLSICVRDGDHPKQPGFYLINALGSEQAGLSGAKGSIVRRAAVGRAVSNLQKGLAALRATLEGNRWGSGNRVFGTRRSIRLSPACYPLLGMKNLAFRLCR